MTAREIFESVVKGKNFMTPNNRQFFAIKYGAVELSEGVGFTGLKMYGVTVVRCGESDHDASKYFYSLKEAKEYIKSLK